jgi:hypothetical protein
MEGAMKVLIHPKTGKTEIVIHSKDLWSGDVTLAKIIHPMLVKYRKLYNNPNHMKSFPGKVIDIKPYELTAEQEAFFLNKWIQILDDMIYSFYWIKNGYDPYWKEMSKEMDQLVKIRKKELNRKKLDISERMDAWKPAFDARRLERALHDEKVQKGLDLFAQYYKSLWI